MEGGNAKSLIYPAAPLTRMDEVRDLCGTGLPSESENTRIECGGGYL